MVIAAPGYLNEMTLPYASGIFYHGRILYFMPTGFHPMETQAVAMFPFFCSGNSKPLPELVWYMCENYFENAKNAAEAAKLLEPLRGSYVRIAQPVYLRNRAAIAEAEKLILGRPNLIDDFNRVDADFQFISREVLSSLLYEPFMEDGFNGVIAYISEKATTPEQFVGFIAAVCLNRFQMFKGQEAKLVIHEHSWYPFLINGLAALEGSTVHEDEDAGRVEHFRFKIFEAIINPLFGRCDTVAKSEKAAAAMKANPEEISALKGECFEIAREVVLMNTSDESLKQTVLSEKLESKVIEPLRSLTKEPADKLRGIITEFVTTSGVLGAGLGVFYGVDPQTLMTAVSAGALSALVRHLIKHSGRKVRPTEVLVRKVREQGAETQQYIDYLKGISVTQLEKPKL